MTEREAIATLRRLVAVNSFTRNGAGVREVARLCEEIFAPLGFQSRRVASVSAECGDHLILSKAGSGGPGALLVAHLDTVFPPETEMAWREEGARIHGPGVADIKGGIVVIAWALSELRALDPEAYRRLDLRVLLNATEEGGCADFPALARAEVGPRDVACLVYETGFEASGGASTIVTARKGAARFRIEVRGHAAHSGNDHAAGASAILEMARMVEKLESWSDPDADLTFNVGLFDGGTTVNTVPARAVARADMRAPRRAVFEEARQRVLALAGEGSVASRDGKARCRILIREEPGYPPWEPGEANRALAERIVACGAALGQTLLPTHRKGASDACHLGDLIPTVDGLGPVGRDTHQASESILRASLEERMRLSVALLRELA